MVNFTGTTHYISANAAEGENCTPGKAKITQIAAEGENCTPGKAKITQIAAGTRQPYHLIRETGGGSTVYGWVKAEDFKIIT